MVGTFTLDVLQPYIAVEAARCGLEVNVTCAPYGQLEQSLLDPASALHATKPRVIAIAGQLEDLAPRLVFDFLRLSASEIEEEVAEVVGRLERLARAVRQHGASRILVWNQLAPSVRAAGLADLGLERSQASVVADLNQRLATACRAISGASIFDVARLAAEVGWSRWSDPRLRHWARVPYSTVAQIAIGKELARYLRAIERSPCKCLVLDLDNTLWGGVLGEDGLGGIALGESYPGNVFKEFQRILRTYRDRGILLAIASKNNEADVVEAFERHPDMVLRWDDFGARQIHWNDKATSLQAIAEELNIGIDSLAFFDDNPVERAWVAERLPEVCVIDVPKDPLGYVPALEAAGVFDALVVTQEDRDRAELYRTENVRKTLQSRTGTIEEFLRALEMRITIGEFDAATLPRIVQLLGKTNQFNLTTRRHDEAGLAGILETGGIGIWMRVADRFGDNGLVGVALAIPQDNDYVLDTFLMSCRVLGRMAETTMLHALARRVRTRGARWLWGEFIPTRKNAPAAQFLPSHGFVPLDGRWRLELGAQPELDASMFQVIDPLP